jgi:hypothetical protein
VNQVLPEIPVLGDLVKNLYEYHYDKFFALGLFSPHSQPRQLTLTTHDFQLPSSKHTHPPAPPLFTRAFLHKRNAHSRVHTTTIELPKSDFGQPVFSVWDRQELG